MRTIVLITLTLVAAVAAAIPRTRENVAKSRMLVDEIIAKHESAARATAPVATSGPNKRVVIENFFTTRVDHFNPQNADEWTLRYFSLPDFYLPGGPILIFLGGWVPISPSMIDDTSLIYEMAEELSGAVYAFESRFYGDSKITEDLSTANLRFLNTDQILADLAEFVTYLKRDVLQNEYAHVLVAGAEYGGALATWFRVRYPHLADMAWASSGFQNAIMNFQEFSEAWGDSLIEFGSQECYDEIFVAFHVMQNLIDVGLESVLFEKFNICTEINPEDRFQVMYFFQMLMTAVEMYTLRNRNVSDFAEVCADITGTNAATAVDAFAVWFNTKFAVDVGCVVVDPDVVVEVFSQTAWETDFNQEGIRQRLYQKCTEFGWFFTTDSDFQPFGSRVMMELYSETCQRVFGDWQSFETMYYGINRANNRFGAASPAIGQAHFTNGGGDPWRRASITDDLSPYALADVIPGELSSADIRAISDRDSEQLVEVKRRVKSLVSHYLFPVDPRAAVPSADEAVAVENFFSIDSFGSSSVPDYTNILRNHIMRTIVLIALVLVAAVAAGVHRSEPNMQANRQLIHQMLTRHMRMPQRKPTASADPNKKVVIENFFTTRTDHFNNQNTEEWTLRYLSVTDYYLPGGPILIFLGGNRPIVPEMIDDSTLIYEMGREMNGAVFAFESRFYGSSRVTEDLSTEHLRLLSADQILADLAEFVTYLKREVLEDETARVLVAGNELGGALAAWFRIRYPHLGHAAWSSSGYLHAVLNFQDFSEAWGDSLILHGSQQCYNEIFVAFHVMQNLIDLGRSDLLFEKFNICTQIDPENTFQVQYFFFILMVSVEIYTLRNQDLADFTEVCGDITEPDAETAVDAFANWFNTKWAVDIGCVVSDPDVAVEIFQDSDWESSFNQQGARQWMYQECTEFGWFFTTDSAFQPFGDRVKIDLYIEMCRRIFGNWITSESMARGVDRANNRFGGATPGSSLTHFTNGDADPWRMVSITRNLTEDATAVVIPNMLGGADLPRISDNDSEELQEIKRTLKYTLANYLFPMTPYGSP
ncbi:uncharacterized protein LOC131680850 [Topomyia yanbarensis]|uniref:uncharacterized protein LOC131680850 n=1 Tax=Topomyia yanbarensis TaxID=2498891 RepID=UPI00273AF04C|nr:uncharacterized protein LOC131680850 [Topomyia yanbarensis]